MPLPPDGELTQTEEFETAYPRLHADVSPFKQRCWPATYLWSNPVSNGFFGRSPAAPRGAGQRGAPHGRTTLGSGRRLARSCPAQGTASVGTSGHGRLPMERNRGRILSDRPRPPLAPGSGSAPSRCRSCPDAHFARKGVTDPEEKGVSMNQ